VTGKSNTTALRKAFVDSVSDGLNGISLDIRQKEIITALPGRRRPQLAQGIGPQRKRATKKYMDEKRDLEEVMWMVGSAGGKMEARQHKTNSKEQ